MIARAQARPVAALTCFVLVAAVACTQARDATEEGASTSTAAADVAMLQVEPSPPPPVAAPTAPNRAGAVGDAFGTGSGAGSGGRGGLGGAARRVAAPAGVNVGAGAFSVPQAGSAMDTASVVASAMLIRTGSASIEVDSLEPAIAAVQAMATRLGGYVANTNMQTGEGATRQAVLDLRLPSSRFDAATGALRPIGKVESLAINTTDVGEEFVDIQARVANARRLEERLIVLLATRTGKLEEVLAVERELARVREEIERYDGRLRYLRTRVSLSTLTVVVHEPAPVIARRPGHSPLAEAFRDAWRNFVGFLAGIIAMLGWLVPLAVIVGAIVWAGRRWIPRRTVTPPPLT